MMTRLIEPTTVDFRRLPTLPLSDRDQLPDLSAVYFVLGNGIILYVGRSTNLVQRWATHEKLSDLTTPDIKIAWLECDRSILQKTEESFINFFTPQLNQLRPSRKVFRAVKLQKNVVVTEG